MNRNEMLQQLNQTAEWDIIIIGGGATGLGTAVDAATRGYKTLLLEQYDFAKGTSSRSTKLVHGGVRYLAQGNIKLVREALKERDFLLKNAPHVTSSVSFVLPCFSLWQKIYYGIGLKVYDVMAGNWGLGKTTIISKKRTRQLLPSINPKKLSGAIIYQDGQFDDARLAVNLAQTAVEKGATVLNYCKVIHLIKQDNKVTGVKVSEVLSGSEYHLKCKVVINATGVFADEILQMDEIDAKNIVSPSQGIHLVIEKKFFPGNYALMIPKTDDGRVLFAVPWYNKVVVGTTDTPVKKCLIEPEPLEKEIEFILHHFNRYLVSQITRTDVKSVFAGLRPLVKKDIIGKTSLMPRDHTILVSSSGLVTITGGKWTTYRKMANDVINKAIPVAGLQKKISTTEKLKIYGWQNNIDKNDSLHFYGSDAEKIKTLCNNNEMLEELIHPALPDIKAQVIWAVQNEMAVTVEDVLARRTRMLFLDAQAAKEAAPCVAHLMAKQMGKDDDWIMQEINNFNNVAKQYLLS